MTVPLSRALWWGGQFKRIIVGLVKQSLFKVTGRANLTEQELEEILLGIEIVLNNRPLTYIEEDIQVPVSTPKYFVVWATCNNSKRAAR